MLETSARLLRLLALLQARREVTGPDLASQLGVSQRTVRNDIDRLRNLGYPVEATRGAVGGYRLGAGAELPPLLLDDDEAVAVTVSLRSTVGASIAGMDDAALRGLAKLERLLPARLRGRVGALASSMVAVPPDRAAPTVDADVLLTLAGACRDGVELRFDYAGHDGSVTRRVVEPHHVVSWGRRWYLVAWDLGRDDWRTFRVDRVVPVGNALGGRFVARELPGGDVAAFVSRGVSGAAWRHRADVVVHAPAGAVLARVNPAVGSVEPLDDRSCLLRTGADDVTTLAVHLGLLGMDFTVDGPAELVAELRTQAARYARAVGGPAAGEPEVTTPVRG